MLQNTGTCHQNKRTGTNIVKGKTSWQTQKLEVYPLRPPNDNKKITPKSPCIYYFFKKYMYNNLVLGNLLYMQNIYVCGDYMDCISLKSPFKQLA